MDATAIDSFYYSARNQFFPSRRLSKSDSSIHQIELSNAFVRYQQIGQGKRTIVLCPDLPNTIEHNRGLIEKLRSHAQIICIEMPGQGFSFPKRGFRFGLSDYATVLTELLDQLQVRNVILEAPCLYSFAALEVANRRPDLVGKLVFTQTPSLTEEQAWCRFVDFNGKKILHRKSLQSFYWRISCHQNILGCQFGTRSSKSVPLGVQKIWCR